VIVYHPKTACRLRLAAPGERCFLESAGLKDTSKGAFTQYGFIDIDIFLKDVGFFGGDDRFL